VVEDDSVLFTIEEGKLFMELKEFLLGEPEVMLFTSDSQDYYPEGKRRIEAQKFIENRKQKTADAQKPTKTSVKGGKKKRKGKKRKNKKKSVSKQEL